MKAAIQAIKRRKGVLYWEGAFCRSSFCFFFFFRKKNSTFSCAVTLPALLLDYHPMSAAQLGSLLMAGLSAAAAQFAVTSAYRYAPAKELSVYDYSQVLFSAVRGRKGLAHPG